MATGYTGGDPSKLDKTGGTMTGPLAVPGLSVAGDPAASQVYVDAAAELLMAALGYMDSAIETSPRTIDGAYTLSTGRTELSYLTAYRTQTISRIGVASRGTPSTGITGIRKGLYVVNADLSVTLVARTAMLSGGYTASWTEYIDPLNPTGLRSDGTPFPASYTMVKGQRYAFGHFVSFTAGSVVLRGYAINTAGSLNARPPKIAGGVGGGQTDLALSYTDAQLPGSGNAIYMYGLA